MKKLIALLLALVMVFSLVACGAKEEAPAKTTETTETTKETTSESTAETPVEADGQITLRMIDTLASETRTAAIQEIIDKYEELNPNVTIELITPPTDGADQKVQQMLMAGEPLDIIDTGNQFAQCITNGWVQPLNDYLADWDELGTISTQAASRMTHLDPAGETQWCVPYGIYQRLLFYRKDLLANAGIEVPEVWTWDDVYEIGKAVTDPEAGIYGWAFRGGARGYCVLEELYYATLTDEDILGNENYTWIGSDGTCIWNNPKAIDTLEFYKSLYTDCSSPDSIAWGFTEMVQGFMSGTVALLLNDNDVIQSCESGLDPEVWGVANVPIGASGYGTQSAGYGGWAMTAHTQYPEQAADFIKFLSNSENNGLFCEKTGLIPIHTTTIEQNEYFSSGSYDVFNQMSELGVYRTFSQEFLAYNEFISWETDRDAAIQSYIMGEVSAEDLAGYFASVVDGAIAANGELW